MKNKVRTAVAGTASAVTVAAGVLLGAAPADAAVRHCSYPYVCLYAGSQTARPTGRFQDVTSGWQWLTRSFGDRSFYNTRHHTVAYVLTTGGRTVCLRPGARGGLMNGGATAIRISNRTSC
jgi:hypothetical protein